MRGDTRGIHDRENEDVREGRQIRDSRSVDAYN
jgi:hypothetical protein